MKDSLGRRLARAGGSVLRAYPVAWLALWLVLQVAPQRSGVSALVEVFAPYLALGPAALGLVLWRQGGLRTRLALGLCLALAVSYWTPELRAAPALLPSSAHTLTAITWNVEVGGDRVAIQSVLAAGPADLVALVEFNDTWLAQDPAVTAHYPYRVRRPGNPVDGLVLLSRYPIQASGFVPGTAEDAAGPRAIWADVAMPGGAAVRVVAAHPPNAALWGGSQARVYDSRRRDVEIQAIHAFLAPTLAQGGPLLLLGDFNVTEREPAYADLSAGLINAQQAAGRGWGRTWRPDRVKRWVPPLIRIDYLLTSPTVRPLTVTVDCTLRGSDHCLVAGRFALP